MKQTQTNPQDHNDVNPSTKVSLLIINCIILSIGNCGGPLIMRLYFIHHGQSVWLSSWLETAGWPLILLLLIPLYFHRRRAAAPTPTTFFLMKPRLLVASAAIGTLTGLDDYLYAYGVARLPVSTSALVIATQLAFTAGFAFLLVKQKFTSFSVNAVVLLTAGAGVLALHTSSDRPKGVTKREYVLGFVLTLAAAALYGFILPLIELTYRKAKQVITYTLVLEIQMVMCLFATLFCTVGMLVTNDFQVRLEPSCKFVLHSNGYGFILRVLFLLIHMQVCVTSFVFCIHLLLTSFFLV